jgi:hypothetical protein
MTTARAPATITSRFADDCKKTDGALLGSAPSAGQAMVF